MSLGDPQVKALSELSEAADRLEKAKREYEEARLNHDRKRTAAQRMAPQVFKLFNNMSNDE